MNLTRVLPVFSIAFAVLYVAAMNYNLPLVTYFPATGVWAALRPNLPAANIVAMYWYGWLLTAFLGAAVLTVAASFLPERRTARLWAIGSWLVPVVLILLLFYLLWPWFTRVR